MQCDIVLPNNWTPRNAQIPAMNAWLHDNKLINDWIWHRRFGKDDCALHGTAYKAHQRVANYWHMLPQKDQVRKAVWDAINPRTAIITAIIILVAGSIGVIDTIKALL